MANRPNDQKPAAKRRLRIPAALAVAVVGTSATVAMTFAGCNSSPTPDPIDAKPSNNVHADGGNGDSETPDSIIDAGVDALVDRDAAPLPPDAPKPIDARPDTPVA